MFDLWQGGAMGTVVSSMALSGIPFVCRRPQLSVIRAPSFFLELFICGA